MENGNSAKDSMYLALITRAIADKKEHPRKNGVKMQAHHAISGEGMKQSGLGKKIEKYGYDINLLPNLVFIPCTLQGACLLGIQPHRGNHTAMVDQDDYLDDNEPYGYHEMVARRLVALELPISRECDGKNIVEISIVQTKLDQLSEDIVDLIQEKPTKAPLTSVARYFSAGERIGCGGVDTVPSHKGVTLCPVGRNHHQKQALGQKEENITFTNGVVPFRLKPGE